MSYPCYCASTTRTATMVNRFFSAAAALYSGDMPPNASVGTCMRPLSSVPPPMRPDAPEPFGTSPFARTIVRRVEARGVLRARRRDGDVPSAVTIAGRTVVADMLVREARPVLCC